MPPNETFSGVEGGGRRCETQDEGLNASAGAPSLAPAPRKQPVGTQIMSSVIGL